jgi:ankyrin repeat protein
MAIRSELLTKPVFELMLGAMEGSSSYIFPVVKLAGDQKGSSLLHSACKIVGLPTQHMIITTLLEHGMSVNSRDILNRTPLHVAARFRNKTAISTLIQAGADINADNDVSY